MSAIRYIFACFGSEPVCCVMDTDRKKICSPKLMKRIRVGSNSSGMIEASENDRRRNTESPMKSDLDFEIYDVIGKGGNAIVNLAKCVKNNNFYAIKRNINPRKGSDVAARELDIMRQLHHPNLLTYHSSLTFNTELWIVLDYYRFGSLEDIKTRDNGRTPKLFSDRMIASLMLDVLGGLMYMHHTGFIHCDIKPGNILLREDGNAVLSDFGSTRTFYDKSPELVTTLMFRAPELVSPTSLTCRADIWAVGVTAIFLSGDITYEMYDFSNAFVFLYKQYGRKSRLHDWVTTACLSYNPKSRHTAWMQIHHKFFDKPMKKRDLVKIVSMVPPKPLKLKKQERPYLEKPQRRPYVNGSVEMVTPAV